MSINLELYKVFHAVAYYKNISHAAETLYISQPAVSQSIRKLETDLEVKLFCRGSKGVTLTPEGETFFDYIDQALNAISRGEKVLTELKNKQRGVVTIGVTTTLWTHFLLPHLKTFMKEYPKIKIKIINKPTLETLKLIDQGIIDFGIVVQPFNLTNYNFSKLTDIQDIFVAAPDYLLAQNITKPNEIFSKCSFILLETDNISRQFIDRYFAENNLAITPEMEINNTDFLLEFTKIGLGVTTVVKNFVEKELTIGSLVEIPVTPPIPHRTVGIICDKKKPLSLATQTFLSYFTLLPTRLPSS